MTWLPDVLRYVAFAGIGLAFALQVWARDLASAGVAIQVAFLASGVVVFVCAVAAKRLRIRANERDTLDDSRPPILFLRSFEQDNEARNALISLSPVRLFSTLFWGFEDRIMGTFRPYGPFVIVDSRSRLTPGSGGVLVSLPDAMWRERVQELMKDAGLIIIVAGQSRGVLWEIELALTLEDRQKVLIVTRNGVEYEVARACLSNALEEEHSVPPWPHPFRFTRTYFTYVDGAGRAHSVTPTNWRAAIDRFQAPYRSSRGIWMTLVRCVPGFFAQNKLPLPSLPANPKERAAA